MPFLDKCKQRTPSACAWASSRGPFTSRRQLPNSPWMLRLPIDDYRDAGDLAELRAPSGDSLEAANRTWWTAKLDGSGLQAMLPASNPFKSHPLFELFRTCRANLLMLSDNGEIHPGPTLYDSFWYRDSSVEGIACSLAGDQNLPRRQFGNNYLNGYNRTTDRLGPVSLKGFFGGKHEKDSFEWDSNGEVLWAYGRFDRILGTAAAFGKHLFYPYILDGARWIRDNRTTYGLLPSGWSAEHIGDRDKPHYWDDFWGLAGLYEAARLAERAGLPEASEIWAAFDDLKQALAASILWVLNQQHSQGVWQTFIPTGPANVGLLNSSIIGTVCYFHPCRLYMGAKLGDAVDQAARLTLETIWSTFVEGGFRHDSAWQCYGSYLTIQLAHAFLLLGNLDRMEQLLTWAVNERRIRHGCPRWHGRDAGKSFVVPGTNSTVIPWRRTSRRFPSVVVHGRYPTRLGLCGVHPAVARHVVFRGR